MPVALEVVFDFDDRCGRVFQECTDVEKIKIFGYTFADDGSDQIVERLSIAILLGVVALLIIMRIEASPGFILEKAAFVPTTKSISPAS